LNFRQKKPPKNEVITIHAFSLLCEEWHPWTRQSQTLPQERKERDLIFPNTFCCLASFHSSLWGLQDCHHLTDGNSKVQRSQVISLRSHN
jgi:hypothetical protein